MKFSFQLVDGMGNPTLSKKQEADDIDLSDEENNEVIYCRIDDKTAIFDEHVRLDGSLCIRWQVEYTLDKVNDQNVLSAPLPKVKFHKSNFPAKFCKKLQIQPSNSSSKNI